MLAYNLLFSRGRGKGLGRSGFPVSVELFATRKRESGQRLGHLVVVFVLAHVPELERVAVVVNQTEFVWSFKKTVLVPGNVSFPDRLGKYG